MLNRSFLRVFRPSKVRFGSWIEQRPSPRRHRRLKSEKVGMFSDYEIFES